MQTAVVIVVVFLAAVLVLRHLIRRTGADRESACGCSSCQWSASCGREEGEDGTRPGIDAPCRTGDADGARSG